MKISWSLLAVFLLVPSMVSAFVFNNNLKIGSTGTEVLELQRFLNQDMDTRVAQVGPGSIGQETELFGALTKTAVQKFQNKYKTEVLQPAGLLFPTGFVGPLTRSKLNTFSQDVTVVPPAIPIIPPSVPPPPKITVASLDYRVRSNEIIDIYQTDQKIFDFQSGIINEVNKAIEEKRVPVLNFGTSTVPSFGPVSISRISPQQAKPGSQITIIGGGFSPNSNIYFGKDYVVRSVTPFFGNLSFLVPKIPSGRYDLAVKSDAGVSNTLFFIVQDEKKVPVMITSISPTVFIFGETIIISGSGFTATGNEIVTTFDTIKEVASPDGKTLSFTFAPESFRGVNGYGKQNKEAPIGFMVINNNGFFEFPTALNFKY